KITRRVERRAHESAAAFPQRAPPKRSDARNGMMKIRAGFQIAPLKKSVARKTVPQFFRNEKTRSGPLHWRDAGQPFHVSAARKNRRDDGERPRTRSEERR